jgi:Protein of unknown function (DUF2846)
LIAQTAAHISTARLADTGSGGDARRGAKRERTRPMMMWPFLSLRDWVNAAGLLLMLSAAACAALPAPQVAAPPPGQARIWFYRLWDPSESVNVANIDVNGVYVGSVEPGGAFYRDVAPGVYQIVPENRYIDHNQNTNVAVVPGEQVFIAVLDLSSWATAVSGAQFFVHRDAWYVRLVPPQYALAQIASPALVPRPSARPAAASSD